MNRNMKKIFVLMLFLSLIPAVNAGAQFREGASYQELYDSETVTTMKSHVRTLSSAMLEGRKAGSEGEKMAAEYVEETLKSYGVDVLSPKGGETFGLRKENGVRQLGNDQLCIVVFPAYRAIVFHKNLAHFLSPL